MLALGIDPGTAICGYGLVKLERSRLIPIHYGSILTDKDMLPEKRLQIIYEALTGLIKEYKPDFMSVEKLFFNRNVTTAIAVGQARGVIVLSAAMADLPVYEYTPIQIKQAITGTGRADMVMKLLHLTEEPKPDDTADALAIAITGLNFVREKDLMEKLK